VIAVDSSVVIAGFGAWHVLNEAASSVLDEGAAIPAHAMLESYSVLTGFPPPHRAPPVIVNTWLEVRFDRILEPPPASAQRDLVRLFAENGRAGGAIYDGLVALTAKLAGAALTTADTRAAPIYELVGVTMRWLDDAPH
jgi:hypothetical protein